MTHFIYSWYEREGISHYAVYKSSSILRMIHIIVIVYYVTCNLTHSFFIRRILLDNLVPLVFRLVLKTVS